MNLKWSCSFGNLGVCRGDYEIGIATDTASPKYSLGQLLSSVWTFLYDPDVFVLFGHFVAAPDHFNILLRDPECFLFVLLWFVIPVCADMGVRR